MRVKALLDALEAERLTCKHREAELLRKDEEIKKAKSDAGHLQACIEEGEEFIANNLLRRLEKAKKEKEKLATQVENEEDFLTNTLQKRLDQVRKEKVDLESHLEMEQEYLVNKLQKQLSEVIRQKNALEAKIKEGHGGLISKLEQSLDQYKESLQPQGGQQQERESILHLQTQIRSMQDQQALNDQEAAEFRNKCSELEQRLEEVKQDNFIQQAKAHRFREKLQQLQLQRESELLSSECSDERSFNLRVRKSRDGNLATLRSRSEGTQTAGRSSSSRSLVDRQPRSQSATLKESSNSPYRQFNSQTSPHGTSRSSPRSKSSRSDLRTHTEELLQTSPCVRSGSHGKELGHPKSEPTSANVSPFRPGAGIPGHVIYK